MDAALAVAALKGQHDFLLVAADVMAQLVGQALRRRHHHPIRPPNFHMDTGLE
jgi:hypothetical protein